MATVPLKRVAGVARAAMILVGLTATAQLLSILANRNAVGDADAYLAGRTDEQEFATAIAPVALVSIVQFAGLLASAVLVIIWMYRITANHRVLHRSGTRGPGWAIGGWFAPPLVNIIPFLMFRELWKASDPAVPVGGEWRSSAVSPLVTAWFVFNGVMGTILFIASLSGLSTSFSSSERVLAEDITGDQTLAILAALNSVISAVLFLAMARQLTARHRQLTGESTG
jgi:hypothetical protein